MLKLPPARILVALTAIMAVIGLADTASAQDKLDRALREASGPARRSASFSSPSPATKRGRGKLLTQKGKNIDAELPSVGGFAVELTAGELESSATAPSSTAARKSCRDRSAPSGQDRADDHDNSHGHQLYSHLRSAPCSARWVSRLRLRRLGRHGRPDRLRHLSFARVRQPHQGVLRLHRGRVRHAHAVRRLRPRHARRRPDRRHAVLQDVAYPGRGAERRLRRPQGARSERRRQDQRRHPRHRVRDRQQGPSGSTSSTCRSAIRFSSRPRPTRWSSPSRRRRRPASSWWSSAGNHGVDQNGEMGFAGTTSPGNAPSAITVGASDHKATDHA